jgi:hypothetical protein
MRVSAVWTLRPPDGSFPPLGDAMAAIVLILGLIQMAGGVIIWMLAKSAMHEITSVSLFGFGVLAFGLAAIIAKIDDAMKAGKA